MIDPSIFHPIAARDKSIQYTQTWGHLAPVPNVKYSGYVLFNQNTLGTASIMNYGFKGLDGGVWLAQDVAGHFLDRVGESTLHLFVGTYQKFKNGNFRFSGKIKTITEATLIEILKKP